MINVNYCFIIKFHICYKKTNSLCLLSFEILWLITKDWKMNSRVLGVRLALAYSLTERADIVGAYCNQRDGVYLSFVTMVTK